MTDACQILTPGPTRLVYDPVTHRATNESQAFSYTGPCRLWKVSPPQSQPWQDQDVLMTTVYLSLPYDAGTPEPESQVKMTASDDPSVVGKYFQVEAIERSGGLRGARRLLLNSIDSPSSLW
jgi:hypothetical protein